MTGPDGKCGCCSSPRSVAQSLDETTFTSTKSIHHAVVTNNVTRVKNLLASHRARVEERDSAGYVPLLYANSPEAIHALIAAGADPSSSVTPQGHRTLLHRVAARNQLALVKCLVLDHKVTDSVLDADGHYAIDLARQNGHHQVVTFLATCTSLTRANK